MSKKYQVIARKYRPQTFQDVVGQEAIVTTLKNAIRFDKVAHGYLFSGSRGIGKTTLARLFAKALNCQQPKADLEPCNQCPSCLEIISGQSLDVIEIDGASNRGIDDIRQINETVAYAPSHGKYKIYIIDEVHMLTKEAFNALLKTLEEPPERAKFFFATTEPHKVLPTIISRCQRFDLARIQTPLIVSKLQGIAQDLNRVVEPEALHLIARFAEGSLRDAESLLDQILCFVEGPVTPSLVRSSLGLIPEELFFALDQAFASCNLVFAFELVDQLFQTGKDLSHFLEQLIEHYRTLTVCKTKSEKITSLSTLDRYLPSASLYTQAQCLHILDLLIHAEPQFQKSAFQRVSIESILLQIIRSKNRIPIEVLIRRLSELEDRFKEDPSLQVQVESSDCKPQPIAVPEIDPAQSSLQPPQQEDLPSPPIELKPVPFYPHKVLPPAPESIIPDPLQNSAPVEPIAAPLLEESFIAPPAEAKPVSIPSKKKTAPPVVEQPLTEHSAKESKNEDSFPKAIEQEVRHHVSHYDTLMRFAAVELEGTLKKN